MFFAFSGPAVAKSIQRGKKERKNHESIDPIQNNNYGVRVPCWGRACRRTVFPKAKASPAEKGRTCP
jgi:hypothetical protein